MENLIHRTKKVNTKEDFVIFLELLVQDLKNNPDEWENKSLKSFLEAAASWTQDMDGYYQNNDLPVPENVDWNIFANILMAAKTYE